jgi:hypothetical protein
MNMWIIPPGISLTQAQIEDAVARQLRTIYEALERHSELRAFLRFDMVGGRWNLCVRIVTAEPCIFIDRSDDGGTIVNKLVRNLDADQTRRDSRRKFGYVKGNRHNYLFELCQAFKEAGRTKGQAKFLIEQWARTHRDDKERGYIADLVYGPDIDFAAIENRVREEWKRATFGLHYSIPVALADLRSKQEAMLSNRLTQVAEADAERVREAVIQHVYDKGYCPPRENRKCLQHVVACKECWRKWLKSL